MKLLSILLIFSSVFSQNWAVNLDTCTLITIPRSHALQKRSIHMEHLKKMIETNLILQGTPHTLGQPSLDRSTVVQPDCAGIVRKQNNFATMALPLNEIFPSFYREQFIEITEYKDSHAMYKCLTMVVM